MAAEENADENMSENDSDNDGRSGTNNIQEAVAELQRRGARVTILHEDFVLKALYFTTPQMQKSMEMWPEYVHYGKFTDLIDVGYILNVLAVIDSNGEIDIVAACLALEDNSDVLSWFISKFKEEYKQLCYNITFVMINEYSQMKKILQDILNVPVYYSAYCSVTTFRKDVSSGKKMKVSKAEKDAAFKLISEMISSHSETDYNKLYQQFSETVPKEFVEYFNNKWHHIKGEWCVFGRTYYNLLQQSSPKLKYLTAKLKQHITQNAFLTLFIEEFFLYLEKHQDEKENRWRDGLSKRSEKNKIGFKQYDSFLTKHAYLLSYERLKMSEANIECVKCQENESKEYYNFPTEVEDINATDDNCTCIYYKLMKLPCEHIFKVRSINNKCFYSEDICAYRWTQNYYMQCLKYCANFENEDSINIMD